MVAKLAYHFAVSRIVLTKMAVLWLLRHHRTSLFERLYTYLPYVQHAIHEIWSF